MTPDVNPMEQDPRVLQRVPTLLQPNLPVAQGAPTPPKIPMAQAQTPPANPSGVTLPFPQVGQSAVAPMAQRLADLQARGPHQFKNPVGNAFAHVGDAVLGTFAPRAERLIPGTEGNYGMQLGRAERAAKGERETANEGVENKLKGAQTAEQESLPEYHEQVAKNAADRAQASRDVAETRAQGQRDVAETKAGGEKEAHKLKLANSGFKEDEQGNLVPLPYEEMSESQQGLHDLRTAQAEAQQATADLKKAQASNQPQAIALAQARLQSALEAHQIAQRRLGLSESQFELRSQGTVGGVQPPGGMQTDTGQPVGTAFQQNVRPTGRQRNVGNLAESAHEQLQDMRGIIKSRPDIFGPAAGRKTDFTVWLGSQDPDAQRFRAARTIAGDHLAGVFGGRSESALKALDEAIGHFKDNPAAVEAGLNQLDKANQVFLRAGHVNTAGSKPLETPDPQMKAYADKYFGGDVKKAQDYIGQAKK